MTTQDKASPQGVTLREALEELLAVHIGPKINDEKYSYRAVQKARAALSQPPAPEQASGGLSREQQEDKRFFDRLNAAPVAAKPEPQAQAGEPEVVAWFDPGSARAWNSNFKDRCYPLITLQSHREAIAKRDAALQACLQQNEKLKKSLVMWRERQWPGTDQKAVVDREYPAITQAQKALK